MPSLRILLTGNAKPFEKELQRVQKMAADSAKNITTTVAREAHGPISGIVRESLVIAREIASGRGSGRVAGSAAILFSYLRGLAGQSKNSASAAKLLADAYELQALRTSQAASASILKARASEVAFYEAGAESAALAAAADVDRIKAETDMQVAVATRAKAAASAQAAEAAAAEAAATSEVGAASFTAVTGVGLLTAGLAAAALAAGIVYEKFRGLKNVIKEQEFTLPELKDSYVPKLQRHTSDAANAQREVRTEVEKTVVAYNSASAAAKRTSDATKEHYDHLKKMLEVQKGNELARASTPAAKRAVEKKYGASEVKLLADQQREELLNSRNAAVALDSESRRKLAAANSIKVNTREEDHQILQQLNTNAEAAEAYLKGGSVWQEFKKQAAADLGGGPGGRKAALAAIESAGAAGTKSAQDAIARRNAYQDTIANNDLRRAQKAELVKGAAAAAAQAAQIRIEIPAQIAKNKTALNDFTQEQDAEAQKVTPQHQATGPALTQFERAGGLIQGISNIDIDKQQLGELKMISKHLMELRREGRHGVKFG